MASALGVPLIQQLVYPYTKTPQFDDIMSLLTGTSIRWGIDRRIISHELTKLNYLFFRISCHSIWPISHLHSIPLERCVFLYLLVTNALISFPSLFISSLAGFKGVVQNLMVFYFQFLFIGFATLRFRGFSCIQAFLYYSSYRCHISSTKSSSNES